MPVRIFLSHSSMDRTIAGMVKALIEEMFRDVVVDFSSDQTSGGGIRPGVPWLPWIKEHITQADRTYVLLTPNSFKRPWVLWESGAAAGVALGSDRPNVVVPITFGLSEDEIPGPFRGTQYVRGDTDEDGGIMRLFQELNGALNAQLAERVLAATAKSLLPPFFANVRTALEHAAQSDTLLTMANAFPASALTGHWATAYRFRSGKTKKHHADIAALAHVSERLVSADNTVSEPRSEGHARGFRNRIRAELVSRHLIGHWKNINDRRYFGTIHLAVLPGEDVMHGHYTAFSSDVLVNGDEWRWVRLEPSSVKRADLSRVELRNPERIYEILKQHRKSAGPLSLSKISEGR